MFVNRIQDILFENGYIFDEKKSKVISDPETGVSVSKDEDYIYDKLKEKISKPNDYDIMKEQEPPKIVV